MGFTGGVVGGWMGVDVVGAGIPVNEASKGKMCVDIRGSLGGRDILEGE